MDKVSSLSWKASEANSILPTNSASPRPSPWRLSPVMKIPFCINGLSYAEKNFPLTFTEAGLNRKEGEKLEKFFLIKFYGEMENFTYLGGIKASDTRQQLIGFFLELLSSRADNVSSVKIIYFMILHDACFLTRHHTKFRLLKWPTLMNVPSHGCFLTERLLSARRGLFRAPCRALAY